MIDPFIDAYNDRDLETLESLVQVDEPIIDLVATAYSAAPEFDEVSDWATASWDAGDRMRLVGYSAFSPTRRGFQLISSRRSTALRQRGIDAVSTTLDGVTEGCSIVSLRSSGPVQAKGAPCLFYREFGSNESVRKATPPVCREGTADHARSGHVAVWTGERILVWGGDHGGRFPYGDPARTGLNYDPASRRWSMLPSPDGPFASAEVAVWTGSEMIVAGLTSRTWNTVVRSFTPSTTSWRTISFPFGDWSGFEGVWTGEELILWGGPDHSLKPYRRGIAYSPSEDSWRRTARAPVPGRWGHTLTWTGSEMIVLGGTDSDSDRGDGAAYDPASDSWRRIASAPIPARQWTETVWTGTELIVWGGSSISRARADGSAYNPATDSWRTLPKAPLRPRYDHSMTWTGSEVLIFGGYDYKRTLGDGAAYDPATDSWRKLPAAPIRARCCHSAIWTGTELVVFGGSPGFGHIAYGDGAAYDPSRDRWRRVVPKLPGR